MPGGIDDTVFANMLRQEMYNRSLQQQERGAAAGEVAYRDADRRRQEQGQDLALAERYGAVSEEMPTAESLGEMAPAVAARPRAEARAGLGFMEQQQDDARWNKQQDAREAMNQMLEQGKMSRAQGGWDQRMADRSDKGFRQGARHLHEVNQSTRADAARMDRLRLTLDASMKRLRKRMTEQRSMVDHITKAEALQFTVGSLLEGMRAQPAYSESQRVMLNLALQEIEKFSVATEIDMSPLRDEIMNSYLNPGQTPPSNPNDLTEEDTESGFGG